MKERKTLKKIYSQYKYEIQVVIVAIALFIGGYFVSWNFIEKPLNDSQFELCEQVARDVYVQKENVIVEAPEDFNVSMTETTITVSSANGLRGKVIAKLQNGELVMTRDIETTEAVVMSILMGMLFILVAFFILAFYCCDFTKKSTKKSRE